MTYKQVIVVRGDLKLSKGKLAAQVGHGSVEAVLKSSKDAVSKWRNEGMKKVVVKTDTKEDLFKLKAQCEELGIVCGLITDAGHTELPRGTVTVLGVGPDTEEKIDKITGHLKML